MNERIQELAEQAEEMCLHAEPWRILSVCQSADKVWREKFAELILEECLEVTLDYKNDDHYNGWIEYRDAIRKHFGVE